MLSIFFTAFEVVSVVIALVGLAALGLGFVRVMAARRSAGWPQVDGTVLTSTVAGVAAAWKAQVTYRYKVGDKDLRGTSIALEDFESDRATAEALAARFPKGAPVKVFYEPADPSLSVLQPGAYGASAFLPSVGLGLLVLGCTLFAIAYRLAG
ncbi:MAG: DUF3592 domain-containing protein [Archangium sp.]|nr:DUF3592 domain-containing protein [Archangium sp.]